MEANFLGALNRVLAIRIILNCAYFGALLKEEENEVCLKEREREKLDNGRF